MSYNDYSFDIEDASLGAGRLEQLLLHTPYSLEIQVLRIKIEALLTNRSRYGRTDKDDELIFDLIKRLIEIANENRQIIPHFPIFRNLCNRNYTYNPL